MENDPGSGNLPLLSSRARPDARLACAIATLWVAGLSSLHGQEGGVVAEFCREGPDCAEDTLEIVFETGASTHEGQLDPGTEIPIQVVIDVKGLGVQGFSYAVKHDPGFLTLLPERLTMEGTILDAGNPDPRIGPPFFVVARAVPGGFISAAVLRFTELTEMPLGRSVICRAAYRVEIPPACTVIRFVDKQLTASRWSPTVSVTISRVVDGSRRPLSMYPRFFRQGLIGSGPCAETCDDLADDDGDGLVDCDDPDCAAYPLCTGEEICGDGIDNNANNRVDCNDRPCNGEPSCPDEECGDALDNDDDGRVDCEDPDCSFREPCSPPLPVEACDDGVDNDGDLRADCDDNDCIVWLGPCWSPEVCDDGRDNDRDSRADCDDRDCAGNAACPDMELCGDGVDNDSDGSMDCDDPDCTSERPCIEDCADGIDNDRDGFVDALDRSCSGYFPGGIPIPGGAPPMRDYIRGDADGNGRVNVVDALVILRRVAGEAPVFDCTEALNTNADGGVDAADALPVLRWIFLQGPPLPYPFPRCDTDISGGCTQSNPGC